MKRKKAIDRTMYGDYSSNALNHESVKVHKLFYGFLSILIIIYVAYSLVNGRITLPTRFGDVLYLNGVAMYVLFLSLMLLILRFWLPVIEYSRRKKDFYKKNEVSKRFIKYKRWTSVLIWTFSVLSIVIGLVNGGVFN